LLNLSEILQDFEAGTSLQDEPLDTPDLTKVFKEHIKEEPENSRHLDGSLFLVQLVKDDEGARPDISDF